MDKEEEPESCPSNNTNARIERHEENSDIINDNACTCLQNGNCDFYVFEHAANTNEINSEKSV